MNTKKPYMLMNYNPEKHPCRNCTERNAYCHGTCERYLEFERNRPRVPKNQSERDQLSLFDFKEN